MYSHCGDDCAATYIYIVLLKYIEIEKKKKKKKKKTDRVDSLFGYFVVAFSKLVVYFT